MTSVALLMTAGLVYKTYDDCKQDLAQNITRTINKYEKEVAKWKNLYEGESQKVSTMKRELAACKQQGESASKRDMGKEEALHMHLEREAQRKREEENKIFPLKKN
ncbi:hypothetical protein [Candidatus Cardinium hertigii]|nr:hypothetical protein [Candidatus Cardinium hertigii]